VKINTSLVEGAGESDVSRHYEFTDRNITTGTVYYKLEQVDINGRRSYSDVISVAVGSDIFRGTVKVYNNIMAGTYSLRFYNPFAQSLDITVSDITGRTILSQKGRFCDAGDHFLGLKVKNDGVYAITFKGKRTDRIENILILDD
jgi:hypothetical protein